MNKFGLIGKLLKHSFSKQYFENKFNTLNINENSYDLLEFVDLINIKQFILENNYIGLNVTIPYKEK